MRSKRERDLAQLDREVWEAEHPEEAAQREGRVREQLDAVTEAAA